MLYNGHKDRVQVVERSFLVPSHMGHPG